jgi:hypothetical protein
MTFAEKAKNRFFKTIKELRYAMYLTTHPVKGFWEIKHEKEGSLFTSWIILAFTILVMIASNLYTGFIFGGGGRMAVYYRFTDTVISISMLFFGWCIANWSFTCLFEGEGKFVDIIKATSYAMLPFALIQLVMIFLSNYFIQREQVFYGMLNILSVVWMFVLILFSIMITHQYSVLKTLFVTLATIAAMIMLAFLILLFFNLIQQVGDFVTVFYEELMIRMAGG